MTTWWVVVAVILCVEVAIEVFVRFVAHRLPGKIGRNARRLRRARRGL